MHDARPTNFWNKITINYNIVKRLKKKNDFIFIANFRHS